MSWSRYPSTPKTAPTLCRVRVTTGSAGLSRSITHADGFFKLVKSSLPACWELAGIGGTRGTIYSCTFNKFTRIGFLAITISSDNLVRNRLQIHNARSFFRVLSIYHSLLTMQNCVRWLFERMCCEYHGVHYRESGSDVHNPVLCQQIPGMPVLLTLVLQKNLIK